MKSILPIIFVILVLTGAITFALAKRTIPTREVNRFGIAANELQGSIDNTTPTPTKKSSFATTKITPTPFATPTPTQKPTAMPEITEGKESTDSGTSSKTKTKTVASTTKTTKTTVCTPVYGMANTCTEHIVVDTGATDSIFFNFAGLTYIAGLASFIKAKYS